MGSQKLMNGGGYNIDTETGHNGNVLRPLRAANHQHQLNHSDSYGRLRAQENGNTMLSYCNKKVDDFDAYHKLSISNTSQKLPSRATLNGSSTANLTLNGRGRREDEGDYPTMSRASSTTSQIVAKPARPWCWGLCGLCGRSSTGIVNTNNPQQSSVPICLLFIIFLVASVFVVSGIMVYLKAGNF